MDEIDFGKMLKELYRAKREIEEVLVGPGNYLCADGQGEPGGQAFEEAVGQLYSVAYTIKFALKNSGELDFVVSKLECVWENADPEAVPMSEWKWRLLIRVPDAVSTSHLEEAKSELKARKGQDCDQVHLATLEEGRCLQVLHVGPYVEEHATYKRLFDGAADMGLAPAGKPHEIYLSDPRRSAPENLKTILRLPVR